MAAARPIPADQGIRPAPVMRPVAPPPNRPVPNNQPQPANQPRPNQPQPVNPPHPTNQPAPNNQRPAVAPRAATPTPARPTPQPAPNRNPAPNHAQPARPEAKPQPRPESKPAPVPTHPAPQTRPAPADLSRRQQSRRRRRLVLKTGPRSPHPVPNLRLSRFNRVRRHNRSVSRPSRRLRSRTSIRNRKTRSPNLSNRFNRGACSGQRKMGIFPVDSAGRMPIFFR